MASIFCDGACKGNGQRGAIAGWAWAYWPGTAFGEPATAGAKPLRDGPATNQRAELMALLDALRWWESVDGGAITVYTDSMYTINCTSVWGPSWKRKGWKRDSGEPLQNLDLIQPLVAIYKPAWKLVHVRGHQTGSGPLVHGNNWVDRAAVAASIGTVLTPMPSFHATSVIHHIVGPDLEEPLALHIPPESILPEPVKPKSKQKKVAVQMDLRNWFASQMS